MGGCRRMGGRTLGVKRSTLYFRMQKLGISRTNKNPFRRSRVGITREPIFSDPDR